jgi:uncharacterized protein (TIRG00374 family)
MKPTSEQLIERKNKKLTSRILTGMVIGFTIFVLFFLWGDVQQVGQTMFAIPLLIFLLSVVCTLMSYFIRFFKWHFLIKQLHMHVFKKDSLNIFFIGLSMSITPGKIGELLKAYLLKGTSQADFSRSASAVFVDRLSDMFAMLLLISFGITLFAIGYLPFFIVFAGLLIITGLLQSKRISTKLVYLLTANRFLKKFRNPVLFFHESTRGLLRIQTLLPAIMISAVAWFMECVALYVLTRTLDLDLTLLHNVFIFSLGTIAGALSMLPGGLGVAEASITGLFIYFGTGKSTAVSIALLIRIVTLWLGVLIGLIIFFKTRRKYMV